MYNGLHFLMFGVVPMYCFPLRPGNYIRTHISLAADGSIGSVLLLNLFACTICSLSSSNDQICVVTLVIHMCLTFIGRKDSTHRCNLQWKCRCCKVAIELGCTTQPSGQGESTI